MARITWDSKTMSTGVPEVNAQHQEWLRRYNQFDDAIRQGKALEVVHSTLNFFIQYAEFHFKFEESVMDERLCSAAQANHVDHQLMRNILSAYQAYEKQYGYSIGEVIGLKLRMDQWLIKHILTIDIQLRDS